MKWLLLRRLLRPPLLRWGNGGVEVAALEIHRIQALWLVMTTFSLR